MFTEFSNTRRAFTMVEVLASAAIIVTVAAILGVSYSQTNQFFFSQKDNLELQQKARTAMGLIVDNMLNAGGSITIDKTGSCAECSTATFPVPQTDSQTGMIKVTVADPPQVSYDANYAVKLAMNNCPTAPRLERSLSTKPVTDLTDYVSSVQFTARCSAAQAADCPPCTSQDLQSNEIKVSLTVSKYVPSRKSTAIFTLTNIVALRNTEFTITTPAAVQGGGGCLLAGTRVMLQDGTMKAIEQLKIGDAVLGFEKGLLKPAKVVKTFIHPHMEGYLVMTTEDGRVLNITGNHPVYNGHRYIKADKLKLGDSVLIFKDNQAQDVKIKMIEKKEGKIDLYNIEVDKTHNYFAEGILVHNKVNIDVGCDPSDPPPEGCNP